MTTEKFEKLVDEALSNLPEEFKSKLDNVQVVVELWPSAEIAQGRLLLGLYQGIPQTTWGRGLVSAIGDKISVYMGTIMLISHGDEERIKELVIDTVEHEIAHHFGISDARLEQLKR